MNRFLAEPWVRFLTIMLFMKMASIKCGIPGDR